MTRYRIEYCPSCYALFLGAVTPEIMAEVEERELRPKVVDGIEVWESPDDECRACRAERLARQVLEQVGGIGQ
jgi:hypothetical protein